MEHIFVNFYVSRETMEFCGSEKRKEQAQKPALSAVDVGVKEKDMVIGRTQF